MRCSRRRSFSTWRRSVTASGVDPYVNVVTAQTTLLSDQQALNTLQVSEMISAVELVQALGGGWDRSQLPTPSQAGAKVANTDYTMQK